MLVNVSELLIIVANSTADMFSERQIQNMSLEEAIATVQFLTSLAELADLIGNMPRIVVEVMGDESFIIKG